MDEAGLEAVEKRSEVHDAGGHDTEALDDLRTNGYGPGGVGGVGAMGGTTEVKYLRDDGCDNTSNGFSDGVRKNVRWRRYIRRVMKKANRTTFFLAATLSRRTIVDGRITNVTSVRPLTMATKYAQEVYLVF